MLIGWRGPDKVIMVVDHSTSAGMGSPYYLSHREMKDYAFRNGVERPWGPDRGCVIWC